MTADWGALQRAINGDVVLPGAPDYESVRKPVMARFEHLRPAAVVRCATPADVAATLAVTGRLGLGTAIRSGGHSVAGRSSTEGVVLDVTPMRSVAVAGEVATVGAGVRLGDLYDALAEHGLTIPAGCGPSVGIAGLTLGRGLGILGRKHGLTCDHLLGGRRSSSRTVASSTATSTMTGSCSGRCAVPAAATSAWSRPSSSAPAPRPWPRSSS